MVVVDVVRPGAPVLDVKGIFDRQAIAAAGLVGWRL